MADPGGQDGFGQDNFVQLSRRQAPRPVTVEDVPEDQDTHDTSDTTEPQHISGAPPMATTPAATTPAATTPIATTPVATTAHLVPFGGAPTSVRCQPTPPGSSHGKEHAHVPSQLGRESYGGDVGFPGSAAFVSPKVPTPERRFSPLPQQPGFRVPREPHPFPPSSPYMQAHQPQHLQQPRRLPGAPWTPGMSPLQTIPPLQIGGSGIPGLARGTSPYQSPIQFQPPPPEPQLQSPIHPMQPTASDFISPTSTFAVPASPWPNTFASGAPPMSPQVQMSVPPMQPNLAMHSGYELLAHKLAGQGNGPPITPVYRRFGFLSHRLLLHFQDELCELEESLQSLDAADTQSRMRGVGVLPASRRQKTEGELEYQRKEILGKIGFALDTYNKILAAHKQTQSWRDPHYSEVEDYRTYLRQGRFIADDETKFLDAHDDLIALGPPSYQYEPDVPPPKPATPNPPPLSSSRSASAAPPRRRPPPSSRPPPPRPAKMDARLIQAVLAVVALPILMFPFIHSFVQRMVMVLTVVLGAGAVLGQMGLLRIVPGEAVPEYLVSAGVYGAVMIVLAATLDVGGFFF